MVLGSIPNGGNFKVPRRFSTTSASIAQPVERSPLKFLSAAACACAFGFFCTIVAHSVVRKRLLFFFRAMIMIPKKKNVI